MQKELKVIRWKEYDGGLWSSMPVDRDLGVLEGWRYRKADGGDMTRIFPTPKRDAMARSPVRNVSYIPNTRTATKPKPMFIDQGY